MRLQHGPLAERLLPRASAVKHNAAMQFTIKAFELRVVSVLYGRRAGVVEKFFEKAGFPEALPTTSNNSFLKEGHFTPPTSVEICEILSLALQLLDRQHFP